MRRSLLCLLAAAQISATPLSELQAQSLEPRGLIVYKASPQEPSERALVAEFSEIRIFPNVVNGRRIDGTEFRIVSGAFLDYVDYPDLANGVFQTVEQIESFKAAGRKMIVLSEKFKNTETILSDRIEKMKAAASKLNSGMVLVKGEFRKPYPVEDGASTPPSLIATITTTSGEAIQVRSILRADSTKLVVEHAGGFRTVLWTEISDNSRKTLEALPEVAGQIELAEKELSPEEETRQNEARLLNRLIVGTDFIASLFFEPEIKRVTSIPQDQRGSWELVGILDKAAITGEDRNLSITETINAVKAGKFAMRTPSSVEAVLNLSETSFSIDGHENKILHIVTDSSGANFCLLHHSNLIIKIGEAFFFIENALADTAGIGASLPHNQDKSSVMYASLVSIILDLQHVKTVFAARKL